MSDDMLMQVRNAVSRLEPTRGSHATRTLMLRDAVEEWRSETFDSGTLRGMADEDVHNAAVALFCEHLRSMALRTLRANNG